MTTELTRRRALGLAAGATAALAAATATGGGTAAAAPASDWPDTIRLPDGFRPEGITIGRAPYAYFGSLADGSLYRAELRTGLGRIISEGPGTESVGLKIDAYGRLFVCGGPAGDARIVDARSGTVLASYAFAEPGGGFVNDVVLTPDMAWFTDSFNAVLYGLPLGRPSLPGPADVVRLPLTGDWPQDPGPEVFNANGICTTPDGDALLVVQMNSGELHRVDPRTGRTTRADLGDAAPLSNGDGLLILGRTLYVVQQRQHAMDVFHLDRTGHTGTFVTRVTDDRFDVPTTVAVYRDRLYLPNARFTTEPTPQTSYSAVSVPLPV
ncbi:SMP-30/gluconolactonase/LRE family protein [Streptomyces gobiensis]|uniref:SMP-30/gluconolactonase/LRE family protein n=1 Tax=Streptomyces gobiensis TaxID=2875706 RepID=UPI001E4F6CEB|nr:superoxide dismutase [Streptomyces gobiensis]UGY90750.1 superoxide dismutase [Streptomyces gobiensis]